MTQEEFDKKIIAAERIASEVNGKVKFTKNIYCYVLTLTLKSNQFTSMPLELQREILFLMSDAKFVTFTVNTFKIYYPLK